MPTLLRVALLGTFAVGCGAGATDDGPVAVIELALPTNLDGVADDSIEVLPRAALVSSFARSAGRYRLAVRLPATVRSASSCAVRLDDVASIERGFVRLRPALTVEGERTQVGYGQPFELRVVPGCAELEGAVRWTSEREITVSEDGLVVRGTMPSALEAGVDPTPPEPGVVAVSAGERGSVRLTLHAELTDGRTMVVPVELHAAVRATGVPSVAVGARSHLGGSGLALIERPPGSAAALSSVGGVQTFVPDVRGRYGFRTEGGALFTVFAGDHFTTDLDCGRTECHADTAANAARSPMTGIAARLFEELDYTPGCALGCHTAGEPGLDDGGFAAVASSMRVALPAHGGPGAYDALPRELRRTAGVGCTSCHGPGAIPEPGARSRITRTEVCATCHDAPPRYGHVAAFSASRMGRVGEDPRLRAPECASCHTTEGFLASLGTTREPVTPTRSSLDCAACHAPHAADSGPSLLRQVPVPGGTPPILADGPSRICLGCHAPANGTDPTTDLPRASATALVLGRFALNPDGSERIVSAPHRDLPRGCLSCHGTAAAPTIERGAGHSFAASEDVCAGCHTSVPEEPEESRALRARMSAELGDTIGRGHERPGPPRTAEERRRWNAALVLGDRGAFAHAGGHLERILLP